MDELKDMVETDQLKKDLIAFIDKHELDIYYAIPSCGLATFILDALDSYQKAREAEYDYYEEINNEFALLFGAEENGEISSDPSESNCGG